MRASKPKITKRVNPAGSESWCVDGGLINGKRYRRFFATKAEALTHSEQIKIAKQNQGSAAFTLSDKKRLEAAEAYKLLAPLEVSLLEAVHFYIRHAKPKGGIKLCTEAAQELISLKENNGKKPRYVKALRLAFGIFNREFGNTPMNETTREKIEKWLGETNYSLTTKRNYIRDVGILFGFGVNRGYCVENPLSLIEKPTLDDKPPEILTVTQARILLQTALEHREFGLLPYVAIGLFCGLRSSELEALDWQEINLAEKIVQVTATKSKTRKRRIVDISENLIEWLLPFQKKAGKIVKPGWRDRFQRLTKLAGFEQWPSNAMRHSFASYHLALHQNAAKTALQLGHSDTSMLFAHYRELVTQNEASCFWALIPNLFVQQTLVKGL